ncbi:MAG: hypothetical protein KGD60_15450 [Candidatus Thorarchaeota archaeon]|nr:hypothetical protein [Candidatus Thorarchaeota archaeon]
MPRWNVEPETKADLNEFKIEIEKALNLPQDSLSQDGLLRLFLKYKTQVKDVIVTAESVTNNGQSPERVKA